MSIANEISSLVMRLKRLTMVEAKGHLDHPEDLVFLNDIEGANRALNSILATVKNPKAITIKWDGYPALIFGRGPDGKFAIMDKHMFNKKDGAGRAIYSPQAFAQYDQARGVERGELNNLIANIWPDLDKETSGSKGYYWGDLLFSQPLQDVKGEYIFKANPNGITYKVKSDSDIGKMLNNKKAGIAVHQYLDPNAVSTDQATSLNGTIGNLKNNAGVAIIPSSMPIMPNIKVDKNLVNKVKENIKKYGQSVNQLMQTAPQARAGFSTLFTTYINNKIVSGNLQNLVKDFYIYFQNRPMTASMKNKLTDHLNNNKEGVIGAFSIWMALYNLKMHMVNQLNTAAKDSPVQGYLSTGQQSQEGFVSQGLKFIDRMGFSRQNLAGKR